MDEFCFSGFTANIEQPTYLVRENETSVEVCATLSNPSSQNRTVTATLKPSDPPQARGIYIVTGFKKFTQLYNKTSG